MEFDDLDDLFFHNASPQSRLISYLNKEHAFKDEDYENLLNRIKRIKTGSASVIIEGDFGTAKLTIMDSTELPDRDYPTLVGALKDISASNDDILQLSDLLARAGSTRTGQRSIMRQLQGKFPPVSLMMQRPPNGGGGRWVRANATTRRYRSFRNNHPAQNGLMCRMLPPPP